MIRCTVEGSSLDPLYARRVGRPAIENPSGPSSRTIAGIVGRRQERHHATQSPGAGRQPNTASPRDRGAPQPWSQEGWTP